MMKIRLLPAILLAAMLTAISGAAPPPEKPPTKEEEQEQPSAISNTRYASCVLEINRWPIDRMKVFPALIETTAVPEVARGVFGQEIGPHLPEVGLEALTDTPDSSTYRVTVEIEDQPAPPMAKEFLDGLINWLNHVLTQEHERKTDRLRTQLQAVQRARDRAEQTLLVLREQLGNLRDKAGRSDLSRDNLLEEIEDLESQKRQQEMEFFAIRARRKALEEQIARTAAVRQAKLANDPIAKELEAFVKMLEDQQLSEKTSDKDVMIKRREALMHAKIKLAEHQEAIRQSSGGQLLDKWNNELAELTITTAELEARLRFVEERLDSIKERKLLELADEFEFKVDTVMEPAQDTFHRTSRQIEELEINLRSLRPPQVAVLGAQ